VTRAALLLAFAASGAAAAPIPARLVYDASGTRCPGKDELVTAVTRRLGMNPFDTSASSTLMVQVTPTAKGLTATVVRTRPDGTGTGKRELTSTKPDCRELFEAIELEVALAVDPLAKTTPPQALPPPPPPPETTALEPPPPPPTTAPAPVLPPVTYQRGDAPSDTPVNRMTRGALLAERERLQQSRPSSSVGLFIGAAGALAGGVVGNILGFAYGGVGITFNIIGTAAFIAGVVLMTVGIVKRVSLSEHLELIGLRVSEIDAQLEQRRTTGAVDPGPPVPQPASELRRNAPALR
jgi:hypothetical protein